MYECFFGERLAALRMERGVSAREMSLSIGQNESYINRIENGRALPSMQGFFYICEYLRVTPAEFFDRGLRHPDRLRRLMEQMENLTERQFSTVEILVDELLKK